MSRLDDTNKSQDNESTERQMMHPLQREDPIAYKFIQFVRLGYLEEGGSCTDSKTSRTS